MLAEAEGGNGQPSAKGASGKGPRQKTIKKCQTYFSTFFVHWSRAAKRGGFKRGGFPIWTCPSFSVLFCPFSDFPDFSGIFPICAGMVRGFSRFVIFLFLSLLRAPTRNSPERVCDTIWTFPEKVGNTRVWKHPGLASLNAGQKKKTSKIVKMCQKYFLTIFARHQLSGPFGGF